MKQKFDKKREPSANYKISDLVLWSGGTKVLGNDSYQLTALQSLKRYQRYKPSVSVEQLRPFPTAGRESDSDSKVDSTEELLDLLEAYTNKHFSLLFFSFAFFRFLLCDI